MTKSIILLFLLTSITTNTKRCEKQTSHSDVFVPAADSSAIEVSDDCSDFFQSVEEQWYVRPNMPEYWQQPCYKWSDSLEVEMKNNVACLESLSRKEITNFFGKPTASSKTSISYGTSPVCDENFFGSGTFGINFSFNPSDTLILRSVSFSAVSVTTD